MIVGNQYAGQGIQVQFDGNSGLQHRLHRCHDRENPCWYPLKPSLWSGGPARRWLPGSELGGSNISWWRWFHHRMPRSRTLQGADSGNCCRPETRWSRQFLLHAVFLSGRRRVHTGAWSEVLSVDVVRWFRVYSVEHFDSWGCWEWCRGSLRSRSLTWWASNHRILYTTNASLHKYGKLHVQHRSYRVHGKPKPLRELRSAFGSFFLWRCDCRLRQLLPLQEANRNFPRYSQMHWGGVKPVRASNRTKCVRYTWPAFIQ